MIGSLTGYVIAAIAHEAGVNQVSYLYFELAAELVKKELGRQGSVDGLYL